MAKSGILVKSDDLKESFDAATGAITIGIDLGDRFSYCCVLGPQCAQGPQRRKGLIKCGWNHGESVRMNTVSASVEFN